MTPKKQVSPAIRILRGERDASARATHLEAATRKFLVTTNERKQMSTKTNFKRIALVAVASLGLGILNSIPSQAAGNSDALTVATGTQNTVAAGGSFIADSATAATASFTYISGAAIDTYTLRVALKSSPSTNSALPYLMYETATVAGVPASATTSPVDSDAINASVASSTSNIVAAQRYETFTANSDVYIGSRSSTQQRVTVNFRVMINNPTIAGTYVAVITSDPTGGTHALLGANAGSDSVAAAGVEVTITVAGTNTAASSVYSKSQMTQGATYLGVSGASSVDSAVSVAATASTTAKAVIRVILANSDNSTTYADESITVTTTVGTIGRLSAGSIGKSATFQHTTGSTGTDLGIYADGTAGTATITVSTPSVTFSTRTVTFFSTTSSKIVATKKSNTMGVGSNASVVLGKATDANGNVVGADATSTGVYAYSSNTAVVSDSGTACVYNTTWQIHECALTGVKAGEATITLRNSATAGAASTVNSAEVITVTVSTGVPTSLKMEWNKTSYAPGEKATLSVWAVDAAGKPVPAQTISNLINGSFITTSNAFAASGSTLTAGLPNSAVSYELKTRSALLGDSLPSAEATNQISVYMPYSGGSVSVSATAGASLPAAAQAIKITATTTVTDSASTNAAAALAAVTALATTVASLKTLITTLTNLVLKIQKKVKA